MSKQLNFNYNGQDFCLEYTKNTVKTMERNGFVADDLFTKPMSLLPELFAGAFLANHRWTKRNVIDEIFEHMTNRAELLSKLVEMYREPMEGLMKDPESAEGNVTWTASW